MRKDMKHAKRVNKVIEELRGHQRAYATVAAQIVTAHFNMKDAVERQAAFALASGIELAVAGAIVQEEYVQTQLKRKKRCSTKSA